MFEVKVYHHDKDWVRGDLEDKFELINSEFFKTRKAAKDWIESSLSRKSGTKYRYYHKGEPSYCYCYTGIKWQHENSGEMMEEYYEYILKSVKLK